MQTSQRIVCLLTIYYYLYILLHPSDYAKCWYIAMYACSSPAFVVDISYEHLLWASADARFLTGLQAPDAQLSSLMQAVT